MGKGVKYRPYPQTSFRGLFPPSPREKILIFGSPNGAIPAEIPIFRWNLHPYVAHHNKQEKLNYSRHQNFYFDVNVILIEIQNPKNRVDIQQSLDHNITGEMRASISKGNVNMKQ
jgi:hypothetical protein